MGLADYIVLAVILLLAVGVIVYLARRKKKGQSCCGCGGCSGCGNNACENAGGANADSEKSKKE